MTEPLLSVRDLRVSFRTEEGPVIAVHGLSFDVGAGEVLSVVGESGSGKTVSLLSVLGLVDRRNTIVTGEVLFRGQPLLTLPERQMRRVRGGEIALISQDPMTAMTPVHTIGAQIAEQIRAHEPVSRAAARARAVDLLREVGISAPERAVDRFPHELSGGMRQRAVIAMALSCNPDLLIADEPTTALDTTVQAQVLDLLRQLRKLHNSSVVLITHDMGVVAETAERVQVQYAGQRVEEQNVKELFRDPHHPYTAALLSALPERAHSRKLPSIPGVVPGQFDRPEGCLFSPRCRFAMPDCNVSVKRNAARLGQALCNHPLSNGRPIDGTLPREERKGAA